MNLEALAALHQQQQQQQQQASLGLYCDSMVFSDLPDIDRNILYRDFEQKSSPYTYVMKIVDLNRERLLAAYRLSSLFIDYEVGAFHVRGDSPELVAQAVQRVSTMLREPVFTLRVNPDFVVVLRILKDVKKDFSAATGCWLHFIWVSRTVACYGLDGQAASEYAQQVIQAVRRCAANPRLGYNGYLLREQSYDRKYKNLVKKFVDFVESKSGAKVAIKKDDVSGGLIVLQFYGQPASIDEACAVLSREVLSAAPVDGRDNAFGISNGATVTPGASPEGLLRQLMELGLGATVSGTPSLPTRLSAAQILPNLRGFGAERAPVGPSGPSSPGPGVSAGIPPALQPVPA
eukprot:RCo021352